MNIRLSRLSFVCALTALLGAVPAELMAQAPTPTTPQRMKDGNKFMRLKELSGEAVYTPEISMAVRNGPSAKTSDHKWYVVECEFDTAAPWTDDVVFTYYVLTKARQAVDVEAHGGQKYNIHMARVTHTNIPKGSDHKSAVYLKPMSFLRFGEVESIAVEVEIGGEVLTLTEGKSEDKPWWRAATPLEGHLLAKDQTPFAWFNFDEYAEIKR